MLEGLRKPTELIVIVVTLLSYGCPVQAIVKAFGLDERTVGKWRDRAGSHCQKVHPALVETGKLNLVHVQADEIRVKGRSQIAWMGLAMMVSTRLWLAGIVSPTRDRSLADQMLLQVRACSQAMCAILISTDGWAAYPASIQRAFREKVKKVAGRGRARLEVWADLCIATVIKRAEKHRVVEVTRKMTLGALEQAEQLLYASQGGTVLNTAFIERLNGTMRERLDGLEHGMYLLGCTYNFCWPHHELSKATHVGSACTPAMASGLTHHIWSVHELLTYKVAPAAWVELKQRGRPRKQSLLNLVASQRPRLRLRKGILCSATS